MPGQRRHRSEGVLDAPALALTLRFREVRIDRIHPQPRAAAALGPEQGVSGAVLRVAVGAAEPLLDLPVAVAGRRGPRRGAPDDDPLYLPKMSPDIGGPAGRNPFRGLEERGALLKIGD